MTAEPDGTPGDGRTRRAKRRFPGVCRGVFWAIPPALVAILAICLVALPKFIASGYHRAGIEALASTLTGRSVRISGRLSLKLLPQPEFVAGGITITGPDHEIITAASLTMDIAPLPLLHGQILARSMSLQSPRIALPWPVPGGAAAIAPARWLASLHAEISNGVVSLGGLTFTQVFADIFTGGGGAFSISGNGKLNGSPLALSMAFGSLSAAGSAAVTLDIHTSQDPKLLAHLSGTYDSAGTVSGRITFTAETLSAGARPSPPLGGSAVMTGDPNKIALEKLDIRQGGMRLSGSATLSFAPLALDLVLTGQHLVLPLDPGTPRALASAFGRLPVRVAVDATDSTITAGAARLAVPRLRGIAGFTAAGIDITLLDLRLGGGSTLSLSGKTDPAGHLRGRAVFDTSQLGDLLAHFGAHPVLPPSWQAATLAADLNGGTDHLRFDNLVATLGPDHAAGAAVLVRRRALVGALHFNTLDLAAFAAMLRNPPDIFSRRALSADFELSADRAGLNNIHLARLLLDARLGDRLVVRRLTASLDGGIATASFTLSPDTPAQADNAAAQNAPTAVISAARAILALPSAEPAAALLPPAWQPPAAWVKAPLALSLLAAGPANALAASGVLSLGQLRITAAPVMDLPRQSATGAFTVRYPNAIAAFKAFGLDAGLPWPGAGSISLRAEMLLSPARMGLPDFVLSMGDLTASGRLFYDRGGRLSGAIDADTLALPPLTPSFAPPWPKLAGLQGQIGITAARVLAGGTPFLGPVAATLSLGPGKLALALARASLAGGNLQGDFQGDFQGNFQRNPATDSRDAPAFSLNITAAGLKADALGLPFPFPLALINGRIDGTAALTATGYGLDAWIATLGGGASLIVKDGTIRGVDLRAISQALSGQGRRAGSLRAACLSGGTAFAQLGLAGNFRNGLYTLTSAGLQSRWGSARASGSIDLPRLDLDLHMTLLPAIANPPSIGLALGGRWAAPRRTLVLKRALLGRHPVEQRPLE